MNIKRSIKIALAERGKTSSWLAEQMGVSRVRGSVIANTDRLNSDSLERLAKIFGLPVSEFIALGEKKLPGE